MRRYLVLAWLLQCQRVARAAIDTVSLTVDYQHTCVKRCLLYPGVVGQDVDDMGSIMKCATPYANACYCATASASASRASSFVSVCASSKCAGGDLSQDLSALESVYASYCMAAGFTQPGATDWYTPANGATKTDASATPGSTGSSGPPATTTQVTVVTETSSNSAADQTRGKYLGLLVAAVLVMALS